VVCSFQNDRGRGHLTNGALDEPPTCTVENTIVCLWGNAAPKILLSPPMNIDDNRSCPVCLNGEGAGCKVVVGRGSGGRLRHCLRSRSSRSAWENEKDLKRDFD
jgi:hypothetical protein